MRVLVSLLVVLTLADAAGAGPAIGDRAAGDRALDVPYLPQNEALCGGAAVAMVFRYWGDRHADVQQFAPLVDRRAGGIAEDVLIAAVRNRQWQAVALRGSAGLIRDQLAAGRPLILLLQDRPGRYHYVVAVAADTERVWVHDPSWGPSRSYAIAELMRLWAPSSFWTLLVLPPSPADAAPSPSQDRARIVTSPRAETPVRPAPALQVDATCDRALEAALDEIAVRGFDPADALLGEVRARCPDASRPLSELAGIRFAQRRFAEAGALAEQSLARNTRDLYAWDVLGSSRFMRDDLAGALLAWNQLEKPRLDSVRIQGLTRTRYALVAEALALTPNTLLEEERYRLAERRLRQLPDQVTARVGYRPDADGFVIVDVALSERARRPRGGVAWAAAGTHALVEREVTAVVPGWSGQGEVWTAGWRWSDGQPRVAVSFAAPRVGRWPGVWRVEGSWEAQTFARSANGADRASPRDTRAHAAVGVSNWITSRLRYEVTAGADAWNRQPVTLALGGTLERRLFDDRAAISTSLQNWTGPAFSDGRAHVRVASAHAAIRSSIDTRGFVQLAEVHAEAASGGAPRLVWPGAGDGHARTPLLRAHPLTHDGVIDGPAFGRRMLAVSVESQRWTAWPALAPAGLAIFADAARAWQRLPDATGRPLQIDAGVGLRLRAPGHQGTLRIDYARGLRDGHHAVTAGWTIN